MQQPTQIELWINLEAQEHFPSTCRFSSSLRSVGIDATTEGKGYIYEQSGKPCGNSESVGTITAN